MLNKSFIMGRLTSKPELKYTNSNKAYTRICVAVKRMSDGTDFVNVVVWNKQAENVCNYLDKGSMVLVEGCISMSNYEDKDGNNRTSFEIMAQNINFLDRKKTNTEGSTDEIEETYEEDDTVELDDNFLD